MCRYSVVCRIVKWQQNLVSKIIHYKKCYCLTTTISLMVWHTDVSQILNFARRHFEYSDPPHCVQIRDNNYVSNAYRTMKISQPLPSRCRKFSRLKAFANYLLTQAVTLKPAETKIAWKNVSQVVPGTRSSQHTWGPRPPLSEDRKI